MNKELSPLETLENIEKEIEDYEGFDETTYYQMDRTRFFIIETALKKLERWEKLKITDEEAQWLMTLIRNPESSSNKLKAFEVIKKKEVNVGSFIKCCANISYEEYKKAWGNWKKDILYNLSKEPLTQKEFDLLKEVLFDGK